MSERLGEYELLRELGRGAMGVVHLARHATLEREVALKLLEVRDPRGLARFGAEAQAVARLQHPHIIKLHEARFDGPRPYLVMSYVPGESLEALLEREGPLEPTRAVGIALQLLDALAHAHAQDVLHRDLKPANVLLDRAGQAYLTDFGLAKDLATSREDLTRTGQIVGTPAFMAPEQAMGQRSRIGPATDLYGLGATLYAMLSGRAPHEQSSLMALVAAVTSEDPPSLREVRPDLDPRLDAFVRRCLAKAPERRYASAGAAKQALLQVGEPRPGGSWLPLAAVAVAVAALSVAGVLAARRGGAAPGEVAAVASSGAPAPKAAPTSSGRSTTTAAREAQLRRGLERPVAIAAWPSPTSGCSALVTRGDRLLAVTLSRAKPADERPVQDLHVGWSIPVRGGEPEMFDRAEPDAVVLSSRARGRLGYLTQDGRMLFEIGPRGRVRVGHNILGTWRAAALAGEASDYAIQERIDELSLERLSPGKQRWTRPLASARVAQHRLVVLPGERYLVRLVSVLERPDQYSLVCESVAGQTEGSRVLRDPTRDGGRGPVRPPGLVTLPGDRVAAVEGTRVTVLSVPTLTARALLASKRLHGDVVGGPRRDRLYALAEDPDDRSSWLEVWALGRAPRLLAARPLWKRAYRLALSPSGVNLFVATQAGVDRYPVDLPR